MLKKWLFPLILTYALVGNALASGFSIYEQGAKATAMAGAFIAQANDVTSVFYNPAGMSYLNGIQVNLGTTLITTDFAFIGPENIDSRKYTEAEKGLFPPTHLYATYRVNDRLAAGFGFYTLFGLASKWGSESDPWVGRQLATNTELQTFYYNPAVSYKILENLSVAAGVSLVQGKVKMEKSVYFTPRNVFGESTLEDDATGYGYNFALRYTLLDKIILGVVYRSNVLLEFKNGDASFDFPSTGDVVVDNEISSFFPSSTKGSADLELPDLLGLGLALKLTNNLTFEFDYMQLGWSSYDELTITFDEPVAGRTETVSPRNYEDSYSLRFGLDYRINEPLSVRAGYLWDRHAVPDAYVEPSLPEGDRHNYTVGLGYRWRNLNVDMAYHIILQDDREITNSIHDFNGTYQGIANLFGLGVGYAF